MRSEMNTGIMLLRPTRGGKALVHAWRRAIAATTAGTPTNDQLVFDHLVLSSKLGSVLKDPSVWAKWRHAARGSGGGGSGGSGGGSGGGGGISGGGGGAYAAASADEELLASITLATRDIFLSEAALETDETDEAQVPFAIGTLPAHAFLTGHAFFAQHAHRWHATAALPGAPDTALAQQPLAVHLTFQFGDAPTYAYGKRQRAREAGLWFADPPSYYDAPDTTLGCMLIAC
jgi:hypothetical protein